MLLTSDYVTPAELTGYMRAALEDYAVNQLTLVRWLPDRVIDDLVFRFMRGGGGLVEAATFRSYDAESPIGRRPGAQRVTGELPPISRKLRLGEYDRLRQRKASLDEIRAAIFNDARTLARQIAARMELARGDALVNGQVTIAENGLSATVDFGRSASHEVTAAISWATASTNILADLVSWTDTYVDTNGDLPGAYLTTRTVLGYMLTNDTIRGALAANGVTPSRINREDMNTWLARYDLPPVQTYDARISVDGSATRVIPADTFLMLPEATNDPDGTQLGATLWGTTAEALDSKYSLELAPGIVAGSYSDEDPIAIWTKAAAIALPILANPDLTLKADVVPGG